MKTSTGYFVAGLAIKVLSVGAILLLNFVWGFNLARWIWIPLTLGLGIEWIGMERKVTWPGRWYSKKHPEGEKGEVFLGNFDREGLLRVGWRTKRPGSVAYDIYNKPLRGSSLFPVFVQRDEMLKGGRKPDHMFDDTNWEYRIWPAIRRIGVVLVVVLVVALVTIATSGPK